MKFCQNCGHELNGAVVCPQCGFRALDINDQGIKTKKAIPKLVFLGIVIAVILSALVGLKIYSSIQEKEAAALAAQAEKKAQEEEEARLRKEEKEKEEYNDNLNLAASYMLSDAAEAENIADIIHKVWYNAIFHTSDPETDIYTKANGRFVDDFNDALQKLFEDEDFVDKVQSVRLKREDVVDLMKLLRNPPEGYEEAYSTLKECYEIYMSLTSMVTNPSGSLETFTSGFNNADSEFMACYNKLEIYLD